MDLITTAIQGIGDAMIENGKGSRPLRIAWQIIQILIGILVIVGCFIFAAGYSEWQKDRVKLAAHDQYIKLQDQRNAKYDEFVNGGPRFTRPEGQTLQNLVQLLTAAVDRIKERITAAEVTIGEFSEVRERVVKIETIVERIEKQLERLLHGRAAGGA